MVKRIAVGIDIGSQTTQCVASAVDRSSGTLSILGMGIAESFGVRKGKIVDADAASKSMIAALRRAEKQAGFRIKSATLSAGGVDLAAMRSKGLAAVSRASGEISEHDARRSIEAAQANLEPLSNREILHSIPLVYTIDGGIKTASPVGMTGSKIECEALFVTALQKDVRNLMRSAELAGIVVTDIMAGPLAAARAIIPRRYKEVGTLLIDIGASTVSLAVFEEGIPISLEVLPYGSANITHDLAIGFKMDLERAEELKQVFDARTMSAKKQLAEIVSARLSDIFDLTNKHLKKIERERLLPAGVVVTGGGSQLAELIDFTKDCLELPAQIGALQDAVLPMGVQNSQWATAVGLCLLAQDGVRGRPELGFELTHKAGNFVWRWIKSLLP
ncbi:MAG: cell division protein FtsA [Candidatus Niyogibacteria bacterium]|nr:cell division protein FtsA [Candidatus Niyogibacteria bacterium]